MRQLTTKQKQILNDFLAMQTTKANTWEREVSVFKDGANYLDADSLPHEIYDELRLDNDTEVLYQNIDRYLVDKSNEIYNSIR